MKNQRAQKNSESDSIKPLISLGKNPKGADPLYRGDGRFYTEIFEKGFNARGNNLDLVNHALPGGQANYAQDSSYISTSTSKEIAKNFPYSLYPNTEYTYLYNVVTDRKPVEVLENLEPLAKQKKINIEAFELLTKSEKEKAFKLKIHPSEIKGCWPVAIKEEVYGPDPYFDIEHTRTIQDKFITNPAYKEPRSIKVQKYWKVSQRAGLGLATVGAAQDAESLYDQYQISKKTGDYHNTYQEATRITAGWAFASALGTAGAKSYSICSKIPHPALSVACTVAGSIAGSVVGYVSGSKFGATFYDSSSSRLYIPEGRMTDIYDYHRLDRTLKDHSVGKRREGGTPNRSQFLSHRTLDDSKITREESKKRTQIFNTVNRFFLRSNTEAIPFKPISTSTDNMHPHAKNPFHVPTPPQRPLKLNTPKREEVIDDIKPNIYQQVDEQIELLSKESLPKIQSLIDDLNKEGSSSAKAIAGSAEYLGALDTTQKALGSISNLAYAFGASPEVMKACSITSSIANIGFIAHGLALGSLGPVGAIFSLCGIVSGLASVFGGERKDDTSIIIMQALQQVFHQLGQLREEMHARFDHLEGKLDVISLQVIELCSKNTLRFEDLIERLSSLKESMEKRHETLNQGQNKLYDLILGQVRKSAEQQISQQLSYIETEFQKILNRQEIGISSYDEKRATIQTILSKNSKNVAITSGNIKLNPLNISKELVIHKQHSVSFNINFLLNVYRNHFNKQLEHSDILANPLVWQYGTLILSDLMTRFYSKNLTSISEYDIDLLKSVSNEGKKISDFIHKSQSPEFIQLVIRDYFQALSNLSSNYDIFYHGIISKTDEALKDKFKQKLTKKYLHDQRDYALLSHQLNNIPIRTRISQKEPENHNFNFRCKPKILMYQGAWFAPMVKNSDGVLGDGYTNHNPYTLIEENKYIEKQRKSMQAAWRNTLEQKQLNQGYLQIIKDRIDCMYRDNKYCPIFLYPDVKSEVNNLLLPWMSNDFVEIAPLYVQLHLMGAGEIKSYYLVESRGENDLNRKELLIYTCFEYQDPGNNAKNSILINSLKTSFNRGLYSAPEALWLFLVGGREYVVGKSTLEATMMSYPHMCVLPKNFNENKKGISHHFASHDFQYTSSSAEVPDIIYDLLNYHRQNLVETYQQEMADKLEHNAKCELLPDILDVDAKYKIMHQFLSLAVDRLDGKNAADLFKLLNSPALIFDKSRFVEQLTTERKIDFSQTLQIERLFTNSALSDVNLALSRTFQFQVVLDEFNDFVKTTKPGSVIPSDKVKGLKESLKSIAKTYFSTAHLLDKETCKTVFTNMIKNTLEEERNQGLDIELAGIESESIGLNINEGTNKFAFFLSKNNEQVIEGKVERVPSLRE